jgi:hypothetical protein
VAVWSYSSGAQWESVGMSHLASYCIHTFRHSADLAAQANIGGTHELIEHKRWVTGCRLWAEAKQADHQMPILFSAAEEYTGIIYWAIIDNVEIDEHTTTCHYSDLRNIAPARRRSEVNLRVGNRPLSDNLIRPYAICWTPNFLT